MEVFISHISQPTPTVPTPNFYPYFYSINQPVKWNTYTEFNNTEMQEEIFDQFERFVFFINIEDVRLGCALDR